MWLWLSAEMTASGASVVAHRCVTDAVYRSSEACACLAADPNGPKWWGGVGDRLAVEGTCFDYDVVVAGLDSDFQLLRETYASRSYQIAFAKGYIWDGDELVSQEKTDQFDDPTFVLESTSATIGDHPIWALISAATGKSVATLDLRGRIPWPTAILVDGDPEDDEDTGGDEGKPDDVLLMFPSGEMWVILAPFSPDETIQLPKP